MFNELHTVSQARNLLSYVSITDIMYDVREIIAHFKFLSHKVHDIYKVLIQGICPNSFGVGYKT